MKNKLILIAFSSGLGLLHFSPAAVAQPLATTLAANSITSSNATINGTVNPNGALAVGYYQYGLTTNYDNLGGLVALPATNTTQTVPGLVVDAVHGPAGANWVSTGVLPANWYSIASSADGSRLAAVIGGVGNTGGIYTSTNGGGTWTTTVAPTKQWTGIACSADGTQLAAAAYNFGIYASTNGGVTWTQTAAPLEYYSGIASSADGSRLAVTAYGSGNGLYTSTNGGLTWTQTSAPTTNGWSSICLSADGSRLAAAMQNGNVWTSTNGGITWTETTVYAPEGSPLASSADGLKLAAAVDFWYVNTSTNGGLTWTVQVSLNYQDWTSIASSADGTRLAAVASGAGIYMSTNGGFAWTQTSETTATWESIASSADGSQLAAAAKGSGIGIVTSTGTANPLASNTTYHYRAAGLNSAGTSLGNDLTFTTGFGAPIPITLAASGITPTNATLSGTVNPNGTATSAYFEYGLTTSYGSYSATNALTATNIAVAVIDLISNLAPAMTYQFQLVASNTGGITVGGNASFTTLPLPPAVTTLPATVITTTNATVNGTVNPNGVTATFYFQYGLTTSYGSDTATNALAAGSSAVSEFNVLSNLAPGTTYHFQLVASNSGGIGLGSDLTFTNSAGAPTAATLPASSVAATTATLNGSALTGDLTTTGYFRYALTTSYSGYNFTNTLAAAHTLVPVSDLISNLSPGTSYYFQFVASNSAGISPGSNFTFTTPPLPPIVTTLPVTGVTASNATLNSSVNPMAGRTAVYYQYGLTTNYDNLGGFVAVPATNTTQTVPGLVVNALHGPAGAAWTNTGMPNANWDSIASSADGSRLAAVVGGVGNTGGIYTSTNGGVTWTTTVAPTKQWTGIASSADGMQLAASAYNFGIYTSTNGGTTWTQTAAPVEYYSFIASSADGVCLAATTYGSGSGIYTSTNSGLTWIQTGAPTTNGWSSICLSADGSRLAAAMQNGNVWTSTNGGITWTETTVYAPEGSPLASSADGLKLAAAVDFWYINTSTNGGLTWTVQSSLNIQDWTSIASSADGTRLAAVASGAGIYTSTNGGATWTQTSEPNASWQSIASSADGSQLAAVDKGGGIIASTGTNSPLASNTTYHFRAAGLNSAGTGLGNDLTFTLLSAPVAVTLAATGITATNATLNGTVNPNGAVTKFYFQYGLTTSYGSYSATNVLTATNISLSVSDLISNLAPDTIYHFQLVAGNGAGTDLGADLQFTTAFAQGVNFSLKGAAKLSGGKFQFTFTNVDGAGFTVLGTTNLALPLTNWTALGAPTEAPPGHYQFTDPQATNQPRRYYRVTSP